MGRPGHLRGQPRAPRTPAQARRVPRPPGLRRRAQRVGTPTTALRRPHLLHPRWHPMVEKLHDLCDEHNVSTVRADGDTADVPEILDLLIHGGPLDKWGHPVLDITEVTRYLTNDTNAEVLPK